MRVIIAQTSGFCDGVKRAMRIALEAAAKRGGVDSDGPLVHNRQALALLALHGVSSETSAMADSGRPLLIRAHGVPPLRREAWREQGRDLVDATCVHVARNQRLAAEAAERGMAVVLAGDADHAEVQAVAASAGSDCVIVGSPDDFHAIPSGRNVFFLAQTTFNASLFEEMAAILRRDFPGCVVVDTICRATHDRQQEAAALSGRVDATVVVGGKNSANTRRLAEIAGAAGKPVFAVETADELRKEDFSGFSMVGVISGASTPGWITQDVVNRLRAMGRTTPATLAARLFLPLVRGRFTTALSAAGLAIASQAYLLGDVNPSLTVAGAGYVFFAHTLNRRVPDHPEARRLSLADSFYQERRPALLSIAWAAAALSLLLAVLEGAAVFCLFVLAVAAAALYAYFARRPVSQAKSIDVRTYPRNPVTAAGWALTLAGAPMLEARNAVAGAGTMLFVFLICIGTTLIRDLQDIASDSLMGMSTLPSRLGPRAARKLAALVLYAAALLPFPALGALWWGGAEPLQHLLFVLFLPLAPCLGLFLLDMVVRRRIADAVYLQCYADGMGILAGVLALALGGTP